MTLPVKHRVASVDLLKGLVMVIMALDHVRDYFHASAYFFDPADPAQTSLAIFFTRWITHFCAPAFSFLAGLSACLAGKRKTRGELSAFLVKRGLWLIFIEFTVVNFGWYFDLRWRTFGLLVIWVLGVSMIVLAALVHLPRKILLVFCCVLIFGHNLLDGVHFSGSPWWSILHEMNLVYLTKQTQLLIAYPIIPWIAVMGLGYYFGGLYEASFDGARRRRILRVVGASAIVLFFILRTINAYGNPVPWQHFPTLAQNMVAFFNPAKYPPSLQYLLMTLGPLLLLLATFENARGRLVEIFSTYGRVPFFYYVLHIYFVHIAAMIFAAITGFGWQKFLLPTFVFFDRELRGYGVPLWAVYLVWIGIVAFLYPLCKLFDKYKQRHKDKGWLSYL